MTKFSPQELIELHNGEYVAGYSRHPLSRLSRLLQYFELKKDDVIVDFGCGNGMLSGIIHDKMAQYVGVDFSEEFIAAAKSQAEARGIRNVSFERADIVNFCRRNMGRFDKAFTLDFSEHIYDEDFLNIYAAIQGSLKPGGTLYLHTPNGDYLLEILKKKGLMKQFPQHIAVRNAAANVRLLEKCGFSSMHVRYLSHYVAPLSYLHLLSYTPFVGKLFRARILIECAKQ